MKYFTIFLTFITMVIFHSSMVGQVKKKTSHPSKNTIIYEVLKDLADTNVCGRAPDAREVYVGTLLKRDFSEDELRLSGFVLRSADDSRQYINLDFEYISGRAASASGDLQNWLIKGRKMKVFVVRCRKILYAYKIVGL